MSARGTFGNVMARDYAERARGGEKNGPDWLP